MTSTNDDQLVLVIGEALVDLVIEWGKEEEDAEAVPGGSPANVALALSRLGIPAELVAWIGDDAYGHQIVEHLEASNVKLQDGTLGAKETSRAVAWLDELNHATYTFELEWDPKAPITIDPSVGIVHTGSIAAVLEPGTHAVLDALNRAKDQALITYDPNARPQIMGNHLDAGRIVEDIVRAADVVKVSDEDLEWLYPDVSATESADRWLQEFDTTLLVMTRGKEGPIAWTKSGLSAEITPADVPVVDTVGAGDTFMGGLIDALWRRDIRGPQGRDRLAEITQDELTSIVFEASEVADIVVQRRGANPPWAQELGR